MNSQFSNLPLALITRREINKAKANSVLLKDHSAIIQPFWELTDWKQKVFLATIFVDLRFESFFSLDEGAACLWTSMRCCCVWNRLDADALIARDGRASATVDTNWKQWSRRLTRQHETWTLFAHNSVQCTFLFNASVFWPPVLRKKKCFGHYFIVFGSFSTFVCRQMLAWARFNN